MIDYRLAWANKRKHSDQIVDLLKEAFELNHNREPDEIFVKRVYWRLGQAITGQGEADTGFDPTKERIRVAIDPYDPDKLFGFIWWTRRHAETGEPRAYVRALVVAGPYRRQGIGTALIEDMEKFCMEKPSRAVKYTDACLYTRNKDVLGFAEKLGFQLERVWLRRKSNENQSDVDGGKNE